MTAMIQRVIAAAAFVALLAGPAPAQRIPTGTGSTRDPAGPPSLSFPLACEPGKTCEIQHYVDRDPGPGTRDYRCGLKTYDGHPAIDIRLPDMVALRRGVAVLAAAPGKVVRTRDSVADRQIGVGTLDPNDPLGCGNAVVIDHGGGWTTGYCHLRRGSVRVKPGDVVSAGQPIGLVGLSGLTEFPHLHMDVRRNGQAVDPFAPEMSASPSCPAQGPGLWRPAAAARMPYRPGVLLNAGWTSGEPSMDDIENGHIKPVGASPPWLIAYFRSIALMPGDVTEVVLRAPDGTLLAQGAREPLSRWRAQDLHYVGKRRPPAGWPRGVYVAEYRVLRHGVVAVSGRLEMRL